MCGVHAEQNAIINGDPIKMKGATIYIAGFEHDGSFADGQPCLLCRRMIKRHVGAGCLPGPEGNMKEIIHLTDVGGR